MVSEEPVRRNTISVLRRLESKGVGSVENTPDAMQSGDNTTVPSAESLYDVNTNKRLRDAWELRVQIGMQAKKWLQRDDDDSDSDEGAGIVPTDDQPQIPGDAPLMERPPLEPPEYWMKQLPTTDWTQQEQVAWSSQEPIADWTPQEPASSSAWAQQHRRNSECQDANGNIQIDTTAVSAQQPDSVTLVQLKALERQTADLETQLASEVGTRLELEERVAMLEALTQEQGAQLEKLARQLSTRSASIDAVSLQTNPSPLEALSLQNSPSPVLSPISSPRAAS
eukprot:gene9216-10923_t